MIIYVVMNIIIISKVLSSTDYYLEQYEQLLQTEDRMIILKSSDFKENEEIYIKLTGIFNFEYIDFKFYDNYDEINKDDNSKFKHEYPTKNDAQYDVNGAFLYDIKYYTIEKNKKNLGDLKGDYLVIYPNMYGIYDFENTKINQGYSKLVGIIVSVGIVVIIIIVVIVYFCYYRKRRLRGGPGISSNSYKPQQKVPVQYNNGYPPAPNNGYPNL